MEFEELSRRRLSEGGSLWRWEGIRVAVGPAAAAAGGGDS